MASNSVTFHSAFEIVDFVKADTDSGERAVASMPVIDVWKNTLLIRQGSSILETKNGVEMVMFERSFQGGFTREDIVSLVENAQQTWVAGIPLRIPFKGYLFEEEYTWDRNKNKKLKIDPETKVPLRRYVGHWEPGIIVQACDDDIHAWGLDYTQLREYTYLENGARASLNPTERHLGVIAITLQAYNTALGLLDNFPLVSTRVETDINDAGHYFDSVAYVRENGSVPIANKYNPDDLLMPSFPPPAGRLERDQLEEEDIEQKREEFRASSAFAGFTLKAPGTDKPASNAKRSQPGSTNDVIASLRNAHRSRRKLTN